MDALIPRSHGRERAVLLVAFSSEKVTRHDVHGSTNAASAGMRKSGQGETNICSKD